MQTDEYQRERNRLKMAAYRARNVEKCRQQSREAVKRMRDRLKAEGGARPIEPQRILAKQNRPKPTPKAVAPKKQKPSPKTIDRIALLRERFMAFREKKNQ